MTSGEPNVYGWRGLRSGRTYSSSCRMIKLLLEYNQIRSHLYEKRCSGLV